MRRLVRLDRPHALVTEVVHVLDERLYFLCHFSLPHPSPFCFSPSVLVPREGLLKHGHQWTVAREEDGVRGLVLASMLRRDIQPHQRPPCSWHASHKDDRLELLPRCGPDDLFHGARGDGQVP